MEVVSNLLMVSEQSVSALNLLKAAGSSDRDAEKTVSATGFKRLSRFRQSSVSIFIRENQILLKSRIEPLYSNISVLIVVTQSNRNVIPNAASMLQGVLGLPDHTLCLELVDGCNGFVKALKLANSLMTEGEMAAIFSGDINSRMVEKSEPGTAALFGDGYALTVVKKSGDFHSEVRQDGLKGSAIRFGEESPNMVMDGFEIFAFSSRAVPELLSQHILGPFDANRFVVFHQASRLIVETIAKKTGASSSGYPLFNAENLGNLGPASIPGWLACQGSIPPKSEIFCVGFGAGLSWGYAKVVWNAVYNEVVYA